MARITVTDCLDQVDNRFQLVLIAARRTRQLLFGAEPKVEPRPGEKDTVLALREIAAGEIGPEILEEDALLPGFTRLSGVENPFPEYAQDAESAEGTAEDLFIQEEEEQRTVEDAFAEALIGNAAVAAAEAAEADEAAPDAESEAESEAEAADAPETGAGDDAPEAADPADEEDAASEKTPS